MCCVLLLAGGIGPRIALFFWWIFGDKPDAAISSWVWGLLGFLFLPWTTLVWVLVFPGGVDGFDWVWLGLAVLFDLVNIGGGAYGNRSRIASYRT